MLLFVSAFLLAVLEPPTVLAEELSTGIDSDAKCGASGKGSSLMQLDAVKTSKPGFRFGVGGSGRVAIGGGDTGSGGVDDGLSPGEISYLTSCAETVKVNGSYNPDAKCPDSCPFKVDDRNDNDFCTTACVTASMCSKYNPDAPIGDATLGVCRGASVPGCHKANTDGTDTCLECQPFFYLAEDGQCWRKHKWAYNALAITAALVALFAIVYVVNLQTRPILNSTGVKDGLEYRSRQKYRMPTDEVSGRRELFPLTTNLCHTLVGGPGLALHFRFMAALIVWSLLIAIGWVILALAYDEELLVLGTRPYGDDFKNCQLVAFGHDKQLTLMPAKVVFVTFVYIITTIGAFVFGVMQLRFFQLADAEQDTMQDFAIRLLGLPPISGRERLEEELTTSVSQACGKAVVGVSVCWNYADVEDEVNIEMMKVYGDQASPPASEQEQPNCLHRPFMKLEKEIIRLVLDDGAEGASDVKTMVEQVQCATEGYVVFQSEQDRNEALKKLSPGLLFRGASLKAEQTRHEPNSINWQNFDRTGLGTKACRLAKGFGLIFLALLAWAGFFYAPYAWSIMSFDYTGGAQPGIVYSLAFSLVVMIGNQTMAQVCDMIADFMKFKTNDSKETCYMLLYLFSVALNIILDLWTTYFMAYAIMVALNFRTADGRLLPEVTWFMDRFESYAMQRSLGQNLFDYAWPATFLVPFIGEPMAIVMTATRAAVLVVRSHSDMKQWTSRTLLMAIPNDLGRYADCLLNVFVAVLCFYFPGGYTHWMFFLLAFSHAYIYALDHCRVLRVVPRATYSSMDVDWWVQVTFAPVCGLLLSCVLFKNNCQASYCYSGQELLPMCICAFLVHCVVHVLILVYVVPFFGMSEKQLRRDAKTYKDINKTDPCSWFSANPLHCLRSKHIYGDSPPCSYYMPGQEFKMRVNEKIGCYYAEADGGFEDVSTFWTGCK
eukprot:TRINITY_DN10256_c0_g1_i2.p1 TRINITY_DN10256_c0_g1~~TRINITY_DN10256_c0_g1_i2.p1  ORF type:complete len:944 (-),score=125.54 TRINITY_DN10256_c0_g1_i2:92-2923(-)